MSPPIRVSNGNRTTQQPSDYIVRDGDTLSKLARRFGVTVEELLAANPRITNRDLIRTGEGLVIPRPNAQTQQTDQTQQPDPTQQTQQTDQPQPATPTSDVYAPTNTDPQNPVVTPQTPTPAAGLDGIRQGQVVLSRGAEGEVVKQVQELLQRNGLQLRQGADEKFGPETERAVRQFQRQNQLPETGTVDATTLTRLETGATQNARYPEYDRMFADGVMRTTIGVGFDEGGAQREEIRKLVEGLTGQGYQSVDVSQMSDDQIRTQLGVEPNTIDRDGTYFVKRFQHNGRDVTALTRLITPETPNARDRFADAMANDEVVVYSGHGRYGSGPDFDDINSAAGNYRIGDPSERGKVALGQNDLRRTQFTNGYQLMFFDGCNTRGYLDDMRSSRVQGKNTSNLDIIASNTSLSWGTSAQDVLALTGGLTQGQSIDQIRGELNRINAGGDMQQKFTVDGFQDNAVQMRPQ